MAKNDRIGARALIVGGLLVLATGLTAANAAPSDDATVRRPGAHAVVTHTRPVRSAAARPLTIRPRANAGVVDIVGAPGFPGDAYILRQHGWEDPRLYYFGPFRTGGQTFYGDQAGDPVTRGNAGLGQIAGYGPANGGYGGPHFDAVGGFHNGPGPDVRVDDDFASGSLSRPDYGDVAPRYPDVKARVAALGTGVVPLYRDTTPSSDRLTGRRLTAEGRSTTASFEQAKAQFAAPMRREAPVEAGFANGGLSTMGIQVDGDEF